MSLNLTGKIKVYKNEHGYSTTIGAKKEDGTWENSFLPLTFKKGVEIPNKAEIEVTNGFLSFYHTKINDKDYTKFKGVVLEYRLANKQAGGQTNQGLTEE